MFPVWSSAIGLLIGASIGSFLNVVIYRMPRGLSLSDPKNSFCPNCKHQLGVLDLFPLLSWLLLGGKCRYCKVTVPARYFIVEVITGALFAAYWHFWLVQGFDPWRCVFVSFFSAALVAAIYIDLAFYIIPDQVNAAMLLFGLGYNVALILQKSPAAYTWGMPSSIAGALFGIGILWFIALIGRLMFGKDAMGHGDIKMIRGIGAMLFPLGVGITLIVAVVAGVFGGLAQILPRLLAAKRAAEPEESDEDDEDYVPESVGSLVKCGIGYVLCIDVIGLFVPKLYEKYFGENPFAVEAVQDEDADDVGMTTIPFGPYLALGALAVTLFGPQLFGWAQLYWDFVTGAKK